MSEEDNQIPIQQLELVLDVYELQSQQKLKKLQDLFTQKSSIDPAKVFYQDRSSLEVKFQNLISDLIQFLVKQQVPTTQKLRKTFYHILDNPLLLLFKVSRFEIFELRLNGFDIELEPIDAICQVANSLYKNIDQYLQLCQSTPNREPNQREYISYNQFVKQAILSSIQQKIFILYSYLRKGSGILKKKFQNKIKIVEIFNNIQSKLLKILLKYQDWKTLKQISILNYQIYLLENSFQVLFFYMQIPLKSGTQEIFKQLQLLAEKAKQNSNYDIFILLFVKHHQQILDKIKRQQIQPYYYSYIEKILITLLQLWGCRICHYKQFCTLFDLLFKAYNPKEKILQLCLKHAPKLEKQDIALMRTNFKLQLQKKHYQLLSLLHQQNLQNLNQFLSGLYRRNLYTLNFKKLDKQIIINLLILLNGNSSLLQFFQVVQKVLKSWNHSIDLNHSHKYISTQFNYPQLSDDKIQQSLQLIKSLCILQQKNISKDYQKLIKSNTLIKVLIGLIQYLSQKQQQILLKPIGQQLVTQILSFIMRCGNTQQCHYSCLLFSKQIKIISSNNTKKIISQAIKKFIKNNIDAFYIGQCIEIYRNISQNQCASKQLIQLLMYNTIPINNQVKKFRFYGLQVDRLNNLLITNSQQQFLKKQCIIKNNIIQPKNKGIFKLSQLEIVTNPINFQKVMDNYYFNLESNSKRLIQYLVNKWIEIYQQQELCQFYSSCLNELIHQYPISIPILCMVRVDINNQQQYTTRFIQSLCSIVGKNKYAVSILKTILKNCSIRYLNGQNYIKQEINPMVMKSLLKIINQSQQQSIITNSLQIYTQSMIYCNLEKIKLDTIIKTIQKINYTLSKTQKSINIQKLSQCHYQMLGIFYKKKQLDMRKNNLYKLYQKVIWNSIRQYTDNKDNRQINNTKIIDYNVVSPYSITKDYNLQEYKINKYQFNLDNKVQEQIQINIQDIDHQLINNITNNHLQKQQEFTKIDLKFLSTDLRLLFGQTNIRNLQNKQKINLIQNDTNLSINQNQQQDHSNLTFIEYYLKQYQQPSLSTIQILNCIYSLLTNDNSLCFVWTNPKNLQKLIKILMNIFIFIHSQKIFPQIQKNQNNLNSLIINFIIENKQKVMKRILKIFSQIGYSDIWSQSINSIAINLQIIQLLKLEINNQDTFISSLLKISLQNIYLHQQLDKFLYRLFSTRQSNQNSLAYKVIIDRHLLNLIMKSLEIKNLHLISLLIHSNFSNIRLYTDQLHQGLKAINIVSKNRSYNQFIQLSKQYQDQQFIGPMKLFKENFLFFIQIQKDGYQFKKNQQNKLALERIANTIRINKQKPQRQTLQKIIDQYLQEIAKLQTNTANRVKSFYLVTKLRDLSYQNAQTIVILHQILKRQGLQSQKILAQLEKVQIFSLLNQLYNKLILFDSNWLNMDRYNSYRNIDKISIKKYLSICSTRRFSHSMNKIYEAVDLQFDQVLQRCYNVLKIFFNTQQGKLWINKYQIYPAFLVRNFIGDQQKSKKYVNNIKERINPNPIKSIHQIQINSQNLVGGLLKGLRNTNRKQFYNNSIIIKYNEKSYQLQQFLTQLKQYMLKNQTLILAKQTNYLIFNKYKTSQATLGEIQVLGYILAYSIYNNHHINILLHPSLIAALSFNIANINDLISIDFKVWQQLKNILSVSDSKALNLNFSYKFESLQNFQLKHTELIDKGSSKKVNNLNRDQYVDLICCYLLYKNINLQLQRLLEVILLIIPKQLISCTPIKNILNIFYPQQLKDQNLKELMKKIGVVLPQYILYKDTKIDNLKDYQNVCWVQELIFESKQLRGKLWPDETNLFVVTTIGGKGSIELYNNTLIISHFASKEEMKSALLSLSLESSKQQIK